MEFNEKLMELRKSKGWSQEELSGKLDVSRQTVSKWELGQTTPEMNKLMLLSNLFQITLDELISGKQSGVSSGSIRIPPSKHYEYKSKKMLYGVPLIHINLGRGLYRAKGIIAIGNIATGVISMGLFSFGMISFGLIALGLLSFASISLGLAVFGGVAIGGVAAGGVSIGYISVGGLALGIYSVGGCAIAKNIALGDYAQGQIAIGKTVKGTIEFLTNNDFKIMEISKFKTAVSEEFPNINKYITQLFTLIVDKR